jgi:NitT/TauT family transport system substrate-binding protein
VGVALGTNQPYFLDAMLQVHGVAGERVTQQDLKPESAVAAFNAGLIDAAVVSQPHRAQMQSRAGPRMTVFLGEDVYAFRFLLVGKPAYIDSHPQEVQRVLSALIAANEFLQGEPAVARRAVGRAIGVDDETMSRMFDPYDFTVSLDRALLLAMDDQTRWAMKRGLVPAGPVPNYLAVMKVDALAAVRPGAVQLTH